MQSRNEAAYRTHNVPGTENVPGIISQRVVVLAEGSVNYRACLLEQHRTRSSPKYSARHVYERRGRCRESQRTRIRAQEGRDVGGPSTSSASDHFLRIKIFLESFPRLPVVVVCGVLQSVIESTTMVFLVLIHVLNERHDLVQIRCLIPLR
jgi:hypothetical protein